MWFIRFLGDSNYQMYATESRIDASRKNIRAHHESFLEEAPLLPYLHKIQDWMLETLPQLPWTTLVRQAGLLWHTAPPLCFFPPPNLAAN